MALLGHLVEGGVKAGMWNSAVGTIRTDDAAGTLLATPQGIRVPREAIAPFSSCTSNPVARPLDWVNETSTPG